jgi:hypothetical protein
MKHQNHEWGVGLCLEVNGVWAVFHFGCGQLTTVNGSVGLDFLLPQPRDSMQSRRRRKSSLLTSPSYRLPRLPLPSPAAADGLVPCLAPSVARTSPAAAAAAFPCNRRRRLPAQG